jgi:hypothetical protein
MSCPSRLSQWNQEVSTAFAHLSKPQVWGLVLWSAGIAFTGTAGLTQISALLALVLQQSEQTVKQRLREWYLEASHKSGSKQGRKRSELDVTTCFAPLLRWIVRWWKGSQMVLVVDATSFRDQWTVLAISVVIRGCAIPVAWKVVGAHEKGSWRPHWEGLLAHLDGCIPADWMVLVMADRGLYANWLYQAILDRGWHPFLRLNLGIKARAKGEETFDWVSRWVPRPGTSWKGEVDCFAGQASRITGTLLLQWEHGYEHPWILLTDLAPDAAEISWYGLRTWIETGFKDFKRGLWDWHQSKRTEASRVERHWLAMAVAQVWTVSLGCEAEVQAQQQEQGMSLPETHIARKRRKRPAGAASPRSLSCAVRGRLVLLAAVFQGQEMVPGCTLDPEAWPLTLQPPRKLPSASQQRERERRRQYKREGRARKQAAA